jgi:hypothetical protein
MVGGIIWFIAFIRYKYFVTFFSLYEKWHKELKAEKTRKGKLVLAYLIGSFVLTLGFGILMKQLLK